MNKFIKPINYDDPKQFKSLSETANTKDEWDNKFNNLMPDYITELLEIESRIEYDEIDKSEALDHIKKSIIEYGEQLEKALEHAKEDTHEEESIEQDRDNSKSILNTFDSLKIFKHKTIYK